LNARTSADLPADRASTHPLRDRIPVDRDPRPRLARCSPLSPTPMKIDKSLQDDYAILTLRGEFDTFHVPSLQEEAESLLARGIQHIVLNMRFVKFINSTALGCIIRIQRLCKAESGELVIAHPSSFVHDITSKLGIDQVVPVFADEDSAIKHVISSLNAMEFATDAPVDQEKVLISFEDETRNRQIGGQKMLVGTMRNVDSNKALFSWQPSRANLSIDQGKQLFLPGSDLTLKFQVKMFKKGHFKVVGKVSDVQANEDELRVTANFEILTEPDRLALQQFAEDMEFLKRHLPKG
jgi:anti-anti-sigma factor